MSAASVVVVHRGGCFVISGYSPTPSGVGVINDHMGALDETVNDSELGEFVMAALESSGRTVAASSQEISARLKRLHRLARVRSQRQFMAGAKAVSVERASGELVVSPFANLGSAGGFEPSGTYIRPDSRDPSDVARSIKMALEQAT
ncbi:hypothetical protein [Jiangella mangrovi]|uniref:Uncharacterized protein n=1 Tax=Jiangella mangrovi TaxID=1524084 RepID=A0A7W9GWL2_9ACTN|nr:hypothetical protein [Jiangella mangrovi]MBB5791109.1 hypothetical protein [Jiangella mangrovi]